MVPIPFAFFRYNNAMYVKGYYDLVLHIQTSHLLRMVRRAILVLDKWMYECMIALTNALDTVLKNTSKNER